MAGRIDQGWLDAARCNEVDGNRVEDWICRALNVEEARIDADGTVWIARTVLSDGQHDGPLSALAQEQIDDMCATIDRGV